MVVDRPILMILHGPCGDLFFMLHGLNLIVLCYVVLNVLWLVKLFMRFKAVCDEKYTAVKWFKAHSYITSDFFTVSSVNQIRVNINDTSTPIEQLAYQFMWVDWFCYFLSYFALYLDQIIGGIFSSELILEHYFLSISGMGMAKKKSK